MDLVDLMYRYINKFINSDELFESLKNIDLDKYNEEEKLTIKKLISKIKKTEDKLFIDDVKKRLEDISLDIGFNKSN